MDFLKVVLVTGLLANSVLLTACDSSASADDSSLKSADAKTEMRNRAELDGQFEYQLRTEETSMQDDRFPFGFWEITRVYPEVLSDSHPSAAEAANARIAELVDRFRCEGMGDIAFHTREIHLGNGVLSMAYEASWTCASMPSPERVSGFLNLDLADGTEIELDEQFRDRYAFERFQETAIRELLQARESQAASQGVTCPDIRSVNGFHTDGEELWVASLPEEPGPAPCDVKVGFSLPTLKDRLKPDNLLLTPRVRRAQAN